MLKRKNRLDIKHKKNDELECDTNFEICSKEME